MVLYYGFSTYHILAAMVHRINYHKAEKSILLIPSFVFWKLTLYKKIIEYGIFDEIYFFDNNKWRNTCIKETVNIDEVDLLYKETLPYELCVFDEIIVFAVHWPFAVYLALKGVHFTYFEDASGIYIHRDKYIEGHLKLNNPLFLQGMKYGLIDASSFLIDKIYAYIPKKYRCKDSRVINFNIGKEVCKMNDINYRNICSVFCAEKYSCIDFSRKIIFLTGGFSNANMMSNEDMLEMYALVLDYCTDGDLDVVFKEHPDDLNPYNKIFDGVECIPGSVPIELLSKKRLGQVVTIISTGLYGVQAKRKVDFYDFFWDEYKMLHRYNVIKEMIGFLNRFDNFSCYHIGGEEKVFSNLHVGVLSVDRCLKDDKPKLIYIESNNNSDIVSDFVSRKNWILVLYGENKILFDMYCNSRYEIFSKMIEIQHNNGDREYQYLHILSDNESYIEKILKFQYEKDLRYAKEQVRVNKLSRLESKNIAMKKMLDEIKAEVSNMQV